jgi:hypothetical protein
MKLFKLIGATDDQVMEDWEHGTFRKFASSGSDPSPE